MTEAGAVVWFEPNDWHDEDILITVRAYPEPSKKYRETSCIAGICREGQPRRLYPIPHRLMSEENQFHKYDVVNLRVKRSDDPRPESHKVDLSRSFQRIEHVGTELAWAAREQWVAPLRANSMEEIEVTDPRVSRSLALVRPARVERLVIEPTSKDDWDPSKRAKLNQESMFLSRPSTLLEYIPYKFSYRFFCNDGRCKGHKLSVIDWEMLQSYRRWRDEYGSVWQEKFRQKYEGDLVGRDLQFFVGTMRQYPKSWIIIGLYYPPKRKSKVTNLELPLFT